MDDLAQVGLEVSLGEGLKVRQSCRGNIPLPLQVTLTLINKSIEVSMVSHELGEGPGQLQLVAGDGAPATREGEGGLLVISNCFSGQVSSFPHVDSEDNEVVLLDVIHDLALEESLGSIVHDLIAQLGLSNVL